MTEFEIISIMLNYAEFIAQRTEIFMAASIAMIIVGYVAGKSLNKYLKAFVIIIYSGFALYQIQIMLFWMERVEIAVATLNEITKDQLERLPLTYELIQSSVLLGSGSWFSYSTVVHFVIMGLTWAGAVGLMIFRKHLK